MIKNTPRNDSLPPLQRLGQWIDANRTRLNQDEMKNGCLFGNFTAEASDSSDLIRGRLVEIFAEIQDAVAYCLRAAVAAGEAPSALDPVETAAFVVASMPGANLISKAQRDPAPVDRLKKILFASILKI